MEVIKSIKAILATNLKTGEVTRYINAEEAAAGTGVSSASIRNIARGRVKKPNKGYKFAYDGAGSARNAVRVTCKPVIRIDTKTGDRTLYPSAKNASEKNYISRTCITACLKGRTKSAAGYFWEYAKQL